MAVMRTKQVRPGGVLIAMVACGCIYASYLYTFPHFNVRYKLTIDILAGGTRFSESDVVDVNYERTLIGHRLMAGIASHGPSIDLHQFGMIFLVDKAPIIEKSGHVNNAPVATTLSILPLVVSSLNPPGADYARARLNHGPFYGALTGKVDVPLDRLPMIVRFRDIQDPTSMEELNPKDLSSAFGPGSRVISATLETTDRPGSIPAYWPAWIKTAPPEGIKVSILVEGEPVETTTAIVMPRQIRGF